MLKGAVSAHYFLDNIHRSERHLFVCFIVTSNERLKLLSSNNIWDIIFIGIKCRLGSGKGINESRFFDYFAYWRRYHHCFPYYSHHSSQCKKKRRFILNEQFGKPPSPYTALESASAYWKVKSAHKDVSHFIDDITWNDLDMDKIYQRINACQTSIGDEYLYAMLRQPIFEHTKLSDRENLISFLESDPKLRLDIQVILSKMGKAESNGLCTFCYESSVKKLKHPTIYKVIAFFAHSNAWRHIF